MIVPSFFTTTAYRSEGFLGSFAHQRLSNRRRPYFFIYVVAANAIYFEKLFHGSYSCIKSERQTRARGMARSIIQSIAVPFENSVTRVLRNFAYSA